MAEADQVQGSPAVYRSGQEIECWLTDMDGVLVHENHAVPGAAELIQRWVDTSKRFLVLTNNSIFTPRDLAARLRASGLGPLLGLQGRCGGMMAAITSAAVFRCGRAVASAAIRVMRWAVSL